MKKCLIVSGGDFSPLPVEFNFDYVIVCDYGINYCEKLAITPDIILGDFDSFNGNIPQQFKSIPTLTFPVEKDDTDTMLAVKKALSLGYFDITIACALGGRLDHTMANLQTLAYIAAQGGRGKILSADEHIFTLSGNASISIPAKENSSLSIFSVSDETTGLTISGAKYNVDNITLTNTFPLGLGNSWSSSTVNISITSGIALIMESAY